MKVLIIEDEIAAAEDLAQTLVSIIPSISILGIIDSVEYAIKWIKNNVEPDLIFSDIQLADGLSFEVFQTCPVNCPVIFCTAYDEYAIKAFNANGIDYLLKPINEEKLAGSIRKFERLGRYFDRKASGMHELLKLVQHHFKSYKSSFLISWKGQMFPLSVEVIAFFYISRSTTWVYTMDGKSYSIPQSMDDLELSLDPSLFYRANRQFILSFKAIKAVEPHFARKTFVHLHVQSPESVIVSKPRSSHFLQWLQGR